MEKSKFIKTVISMLVFVTILSVGVLFTACKNDDIPNNTADQNQTDNTDDTDGNDDADDADASFDGVYGIKYFAYEFIGGYAVVTGLNESGTTELLKHENKKVFIPGEIAGKKVRVGKDNSPVSLVNFGNVKEIEFLEGVEVIGKNAFSFCRGLTDINIPNSVTVIDNYAFTDCTGLTDITIPDSIKTIGNGAFMNCSALTNIIIPNIMATIGEYAFAGCDTLTDITIPNSITYIGNRAFLDCSSLVAINFAGTKEECQSSQFGLLSWNVLTGSFVETIHCTNGDITL